MKMTGGVVWRVACGVCGARRDAVIG